MTPERYIKLLTIHNDEYKEEIEKLKVENHKLNKKIEYLYELLECYRSRISDLEDILEGEDYEE